MMQGTPRSLHHHVVMWAAMAVLLGGASAVRGAEPSCGEPIRADLTLSADLDCPGDGLVAGADGILIDCAGHRVKGPIAPGTAGVRIEGFPSVVVRNCVIGGFDRALAAREAPRLVVEENRFEGGAAGGILILDSPGARVIRNAMTGYLFGVGVQRSDGVSIAGNRFDAVGGFTAVSVMNSPDGVVTDNVWEGAGTIFFNPARRGRAEGNTFTGGPSQISMYDGVECSIRQNQFTGREVEEGGGIRLAWSSRCNIESNHIERVQIFGVLVEDTPGSSGNRITGNRFRGGSYGIYLENPADEVVEQNTLDDVFIAMPVVNWRNPGEAAPAPGTQTRISGNRITGGIFGLYAVDVDSLLVERNVIQGSTVGILDLSYIAPRSMVSSYEGNQIEDSLFWGMVAWGSSPSLVANIFRRNGRGEEIPVEVGAQLAVLGDLRGAMVFLPWNGALDTFDDGDPDNDLVAQPTLGGSRSLANLFVQNQGLDIYALDARADNDATLLEDNRFAGEALRLRQDWFGLVRVEDGSGAAVEGATVIVHDAQGRVILEGGTGPQGALPPQADPARPLGLIPQEPGGPVPPWLKITEHIVDGRGVTTRLTPHRIAAEGEGSAGCSIYSWDGEGQPGESGMDAGGRYQAARVILEEACPQDAGWPAGLP